MESCILDFSTWSPISWKPVFWSPVFRSLFSWSPVSRSPFSWSPVSWNTVSWSPVSWNTVSWSSVSNNLQNSTLLRTTKYDISKSLRCCSDEEIRVNVFNLVFNSSNGGSLEKYVYSPFNCIWTSFVKIVKIEFVKLFRNFWCQMGLNF